MVSYFLSWTLLKLFSSIPDEQSEQKVRQLGRITCTVINKSNEIKCPLLWEFWIYNFSRIILERVCFESIVNIRNECLFFWVHGKWILAWNKQIGWACNKQIAASRFTPFVCPVLQFIPQEPRKKDTHSLNVLFFMPVTDIVEIMQNITEVALLASCKWRDAQCATFPHFKFIAYTRQGLT